LTAFATAPTAATEAAAAVTVSADNSLALALLVGAASSAASTA
jgi:hypothetical protein